MATIVANTLGGGEIGVTAVVPSSGSRLCLFSDLDGTLVFYPDVMGDLGAVIGTGHNGTLAFKLKETGEEHEVFLLPPSSTGLQGVVSLTTLRRLAAWRAAGNLLVIISGARTSTVMQRLPYLPAADAVVAENGGRLWLRDSRLPTGAQLAEDWRWRARHEAVVGPVMNESLPPEQRHGPLWQLYGELAADGWTLDARSYTTGFRVKLHPKSEAQLAALRGRLPALGLASSFNLGECDIYPTSTGKEGVARYLMREALGVPPERCLLMCDDDNDLGLAAMVAKVFLPSIATDSVRQAAAADPTRFVAARRSGIFGAEESLASVEEYAAGLQAAVAARA